jgi:hypothetical protein
MAWQPAHAHGLLQVRTAVLNEQLRSCFERWYPALAAQRSCSPYRNVSPRFGAVSLEADLLLVIIMHVDYNAHGFQHGDAHG